MPQRDEERQNTYRRIDTVADQLSVRGIWLPFGYRRRDAREPRRTDKEILEDQLFEAYKKYFKFQERTLRAEIRKMLSKLGAADVSKVMKQLEKDIKNDDLEAGIISLIVSSVLLGTEVFIDAQADAFGPQVEWTSAQSEAAAWAVENAGELIKDIDQTTLDAVRQAIQSFIDTPGMTLRDIMDMIPLKDRRSRLIGITETTNAFAEGEIRMGRFLAKEFPGLEIVKIWRTNNDDRVCVICGQDNLDGQQVGLEEMFTYTLDDVEHEVFAPSAHPGCRCWLTVRVGQEVEA